MAKPPILLNICYDCGRILKMFKSDVFKTWALVLQLGISMVVPIFLLIAFAYFVKSYFHIDLMLVAIIFGVLVGIRNVYVIIRNYLDTMSDGKNRESELVKRHKKNLENQRIK